MPLPLQKSHIHKRGIGMVLSSKPGEVQSRFQQISQSPVNLGQSSQDFNKSLNCRITWCKSLSPSLGALNVNLIKGLRTIQVSWQYHKHLILGAVTNLSKIFLKRNSIILEKFITSLADQQSWVYFPNTCRGFILQDKITFQ